MAKSLSVSVVSADHQVWTGEATMVVAKTVEGEIGILAGHEPMLAILAAGDVRLTLADGSKILAQAEDGFLSVDNDMVTIVARKAELVGSK
ncbi:F0F1 ATP synthase subunit epsilon [Cryobacterium sp. PH31-L1]|uniref:F0F1 ATP synthase subunit epsilon n=1 Tax=Cryobacterium sp. PH31-L1 TaxID=3046199 RepID=UPI0024B9D0B0|nr:F0F1 ATP synthase subunit epsilon [Cryobacterium sp. PH31-L1]MDJ0376529.1 F0F1 ATP synthase subunit epsilon [Cryobacterium sp. PH31-L1]